MQKIELTVEYFQLIGDNISIMQREVFSMYVTVPLKDICLIVLLIALIIMVVYLITLFRNLSKTAKKSYEVLEDVKTVTEITEKRTVELDETIGNVTDTLNTVSNAIKGQENIFKQLSTIAGAVMSIVGMITGRNKKDEYEEEAGNTETEAETEE